MISDITPATISLAQLVFLGATAERQCQVRWVHVPCCIGNDLLHFRYNTPTFTVGLLMVNPAGTNINSN